MVKLNNDDIKCISLFQQLTGASVRDCVISKESAVFVVSEGELGRAIGKGGSAIMRVKDAFKRKVDVVEHADDPERFVRNIFSSIEIKNLKIEEGDGGKVAYVTVDPRDRGAAIGRNGERVKLARMLVQRYFNMDLKLI
ncbi:MAG: NusA-like transcription termination signal-binding factor [Candidatus Micrarchaeota archaeon]|nr:NusA-like transcription termination signal-binding factor [Candidatus Micrarchaeota archaeon]